MALSEGDAERVPDSENAESPAPAHPDDAAGAASRSLYDDLEALFTDAKTYLDAELVYQKSRAGFVLNRLKLGIGMAAVAAFFAVLALIGLTVGLIIALTPLVTAWGATAIVVGLLLLVAYLILRGAIKAFRQMAAAMSADAGADNAEDTGNG